jgi:hypothetical protein
MHHPDSGCLIPGVHENPRLHPCSRTGWTQVHRNNDKMMSEALVHHIAFLPLRSRLARKQIAHCFCRDKQSNGSNCCSLFLCRRSRSLRVSFLVLCMALFQNPVYLPLTFYYSFTFSSPVTLPLFIYLFIYFYLSLSLFLAAEISCSL